MSTVSDSKKIIIDTGPLVAFLNKADTYHEWALMHFGRLNPPFYTSESVISEACFLLRHTQEGVEKILDIIERELIFIPFVLVNELSTLKHLVRKYQNIPMSLADASLVRLSEQIANSAIFTLDSDFRIYRRHKRETIPLIIPR
ncbi:MAG TPA: PIN domain-containing protein [Caldithrix abyssi]|uniref:PIN domain-containing protein n=1 Tax=Caldithrix abyssi TaxID=187145 RepID=A0A7V4TZ82_CALAY|nr:PIN domain-containing protein [Caldithrix abyssi]